MGTKTLFSFRFDPDLVRRFDARASSDGAAGLFEGQRGGNHSGRDVGRTAAIERLMELYASDRLQLKPSAGSNPFPGEEVYPGSTPDFPILVTPFRDTVRTERS